MSQGSFCLVNPEKVPPWTFSGALFVQNPTNLVQEQAENQGHGISRSE